MAPNPSAHSAHTKESKVSPSSSDIPVKQVQVDDKLYDAEALSNFHPGGELFVKAFAGSDATEAFWSYHRRRFPHDKKELKEMQVGTIQGSKAAAGTAGVDIDDDFFELCDLVEQVLPRHKSFAPWHYYAKIACVLGATFGLEVYMHLNADYSWYLSATLGFFFALVGLNIQHDANHGAISKNSAVNRVLGLMQSWIGGSALDWIHSHVVQHHVNCNDVQHDPDIEGNDMLRLNPTATVLGHQALQHVYMFGLLCLFGFNFVASTLGLLIRGDHGKQMSVMVWPQRRLDMAMCVLYFVRWVVLPVYQTGSFWTLVETIPMYMVGGFYLAFFFIISHNFEGSKFFDRSKDGSKGSKGHEGLGFLYRQAASSSNVGGSLLCFINGGLNYQIEHHLFPRMSHCHYPLIAPMVRAYCLKKGLPYRHFDSVGENMASCVRHLASMGSDARYAAIAHALQ